MTTTEPQMAYEPLPVDGPPEKKSSLLSIERVVALATPLFAAAGGVVFSLLGKVVPVNLSKGDFTDLFIAGSVLATTAALTWLYGRQKFVHFVQGAEHVTDHVAKAIQENFPQGVPQLRQIQAALEAHEAAIVDNVSQKVGLSPSASAVAKEIVGQLWPQAQPPRPAAGPSTPPPVTGSQG